ncbi:MFS transporter [Streptomyces roseolilacinus]|uniref:Major facilitator superfamily (MFS) profile domain-containing protein n=1 Tax=Streptomyces roseolilacinus TaxID=66904 RepID=A0A918B1Q7_9ACTN|nr:MFS transporter [Streptomyces roseolilacinus]GGQ13015.1 hypothetical protein GCM10010249_34710 [Streptomyces roseolilacinus]
MSPGGRRAALAASVAGPAVVALDGTLLAIAQPTLQRSLDATYAQVQWATTGYLIAVASLLVLAGRLADRYGDRRLFALGAAGFAVTSAGICAAPGIEWVIALRVAQGGCGALLQPATLGMLRTAYPPDRLARPLALRTAAVGVATAAGPLLGGALTAQYGWRPVFALTAAPALLLVALAPAVPRRAAGRERDRPRSLDLPGAGLLALALAALVHALVVWPWSGAVALLAGAALVRRERRAKDPLLSPHVLSAPGVTAALGVLLAASAVLSGCLFAVTYHLQEVSALDPSASALRALPLPLAMVACAPPAAAWTRRRGARAAAVAGTACLALGALALSRLGPSPPPAATTLAFALLGAGFAAVMVATGTVVVREAPPGSAALAGGLKQTASHIGPALGTAAAAALAPALPTALLPLTALAAAATALALRLPRSP